jgi:sucrose-6-phosphate hydrolase SacC (GH32 family)
MPESDGRRIQIAWGQISTPYMPFNQCMLFPVELKLRTTDEGVRMFAEPIDEIKNIHGKKHIWTSEILKPGQDLISGLSGELFHIRGFFDVGSTAQMGFNIRGTEILYDAEKKQISCKDKSAKLEPKNGMIALEILVDRNSIEIFANSGRVYMPMGGVLPEDNKKIELFSKTTEVKVALLEIYELNSIWK